jgi:hypothetical protein
MPELVLLTIAADELKSLNKRIDNRDPAAQEFFLNPWAPHAGKDFACFLCDKAAEPQLEHAPFSQILPDFEPGKCLIVPLCHACSQLHPTIRFHLPDTLQEDVREALRQECSLCLWHAP